ncbi:MAG: nitroreductase family protein [Thainema sp.]
MTIEAQPSMGLQDAIRLRRASRAFNPDPIPDVLLEKILELSIQAPSGYNLQPWRFIVLRDQASKEKLQPCAFGQAQVVQAPVVLICCGDRNVGSPDYIEQVIELGEANDAIDENYANIMRKQIPLGFEQQPSYGSMEVWTNRHVMLAVTHMMIVAKSYGVDSCPMEGFSSEQVKEAFNIPDHVDVCCLLCLGFATEPHKKYSGRFDLSKLFYGESYGEMFSL